MTGPFKEIRRVELTKQKQGGPWVGSFEINNEVFYTHCCNRLANWFEIDGANAVDLVVSLRPTPNSYRIKRRKPDNKSEWSYSFVYESKDGIDLPVPPFISSRRLFDELIEEDYPALYLHCEV